MGGAVHQATLLAGAGAAGLLIGSFLNVVIFRLPRECMSIVQPRSRCLSCLRPILWFDNIPIVSFLVLGGKCRRCGAKLSWRYPLVEGLTGAVFLLLAARAFWGPWGDAPAVAAGRFGVAAGLLATMIAVTFIDLDFRIIPDEISMPGVIAGVAVGFAFPEWFGPRLATALASASPHLAGLATAALGALAGGGLIYAVRTFGSVLFRKEAMGLGDVKYMAMLGAFLGWDHMLLSFVLACLAGSILGIGYYVVTRSRTIAFGPFLSLGAAAVLLFDPEAQRAVAWYVAFVRPHP